MKISAPDAGVQYTEKRRAVQIQGGKHTYIGAVNKLVC
jgi:hypothetical protein